MSKGRLLLTLLAALLAGGVTAQNAKPVATPAPASTPAPKPIISFGAEVTSVEVDAIVTDASGNVIRGLTAADFEIREEGKPQRVDVAAFIDLPIPTAAAAAENVAPRDVRTNETPFEGRLYVIVLDDLHTGATRSTAVRKEAGRFIRRYVAEGDLAAVVFTSGRSASQDLTDDRSLLIRSVDTFMGQRLRSSTLNTIDDYNKNRALGVTDPAKDPERAARGYNARQALDTIKGVADWLANVRGRRKAILLFSEGIDYDIQDMFNTSDTSMIMLGTKNVVAAATRANASIYTIDPRGLHSMGEETMDMQPVLDTSLGLDGTGLRNEQRLAADSLRVLADETLGRAAVETNDFEGAFERVVRDSSSYYMLGYQSTDERRDGRYRKLEVKVRRPGLTVRARKGYTAPRGSGRIEPPTWEGSKTPGPLRELLARPMAAGGLLMSVQAAPFRGAGKNASVMVTVQFGPGSFEPQQKGGEFKDALDLTVAAVSAAGRINGNDAHLDLNMRPQTARLVGAAGFRVVSEIELPKGRYQLRVAARSANSSAIGSVYCDLEVPDFSAEPLSISGLVLGSSSLAIVPTGGAFEPLKGVLQFPPTTFRDFLTTDTLDVAADIYDNEWRTPHTVEVSTSLAEGGAVRWRSETQWDTGALGGSSAFAHHALIPLQDLPPGNYTLRVEARSRMGKRPVAFREIAFAIAENSRR
jgi:VWFA-related protein